MFPISWHPGQVSNVKAMKAYEDVSVVWFEIGKIDWSQAVGSDDFRLLTQGDLLPLESRRDEN